jgi:hypothetical protein
MTFCDPIPKVVAALQPWAEISERLRRNFNLMHYPIVLYGDEVPHDVLYILAGSLIP